MNRTECENLHSYICTNIAKGFEVCANGLIVVKITVSVRGKSGNKIVKKNQCKKPFDLSLSVRVITDDQYQTTKTPKNDCFYLCAI